MSAPDLDKLRSIKSIRSLIKYLRDELDWPIDQNQAEDVSFYDYEAEELGLDKKTAAKVESIKQLRKLTDDQPWGIFIIKFEPRQLPVVVLRRILQSLVIKKRQSASKSELATWNLHDLLFISTYGESENRQFNFAHFSENDPGDLPTLKVLVWDEKDTISHLQKIRQDLYDKLRWPDDDSDLEKWRSQWSSAFTLKHREVIETSKELAVRLAVLAKVVRKQVNSILKMESEKGPYRKLLSAFKESLLHDLTEDGFADMFAQTISYGLLAARISRPSGLVADSLADMVPVTNPFLKDLLETFLKIGGRKNSIDFDEVGLNDVVELLRRSNMEAVIRDFRDRNQNEDPIIHFYEGFAKEYDPIDKVKRGEFYTPWPVVSFIVRSVDELLRTEFGLEYGLADTTTWGEMAERFEELQIPNGATHDQAFVQILDPATGTGTFLVEVIDLIYKTMCKKWSHEGRMELELQQLWNNYVPKHLLPRLYGYELKMAPYTIAHMTIGLKLQETGYRFESDERARIYLTNSLEPPSDKQFKLGLIPALAHESMTVNAVKRVQRFTVVIGNPPYSGISANMTKYAQRIVDPYKIVDGARLNEKKLWLQDDYVKFIRLGQKTIEHSLCGILGYITNHGYLDNPTFRGMRQSLLCSFQRCHVIDLHGNSKKKETTPDGSPDKNVFDIQQGVAIGLFTKTAVAGIAGLTVMRGDLYGRRESKYDALLASNHESFPSTQLNPNRPLYLFAKQDQTYREEYEVMSLLSDVTLTHSVGVVTARDQLTIAFTADEIWDRVKRFSTLNESHARTEFGLRQDVRDWKVSLAQSDLREQPLSRSRILPILYRPFDTRFTYYTGKNKGFIGQPALAIMSHVIRRDNIGIVTTRKVEVGTFGHAIVANTMIESHSVSLKEVNYLFPLWIYSDNERLISSEQRTPNFTPEFLKKMAVSLGLRRENKRRMSQNIVSENTLGYVYSILHSPNYRSRYREFLKTDFPRIPLISSQDLFSSLSQLGSDLISLHLIESPMLNDYITALVGSVDFQVEKVSYSDETVWIDKAKTRGFRGVPEEVWNFHIGGYQVCEKWLKDRQAKGGKNPRPGRILTKEDINHYQKIVVALSETIRIMSEIDEIIEAHGGWPDAFVTTPMEKPQ